MITTSILAGEFKGTRLQTGKMNRFRPTSSRVRESIFNIVSQVKGAIVLDLYAGAGTLGLEALSRGAFSVLFVDSDKEAIRVIRRNSRLFKNRDISIRRMDSIRFLKIKETFFDIILADPPYGLENLMELKQFAWDRLATGGTLVIESSFRDSWQDKQATIKRYGDTQISFFRKE